MSNYKNPFEPGGAFYNPQITDGSKVTEPKIMPRWTEQNKDNIDKLLEQNIFLPVEPQKIKNAIKNGILAIADLGYKLYVNLEKITKTYPTLLTKVNLIVDEIAQIAEKVTDMNTKTMGWGDLTSIWLFELGDYNDGIAIEFTDNDKTTIDLRQAEGVQEAREKAIAKFKTGNTEALTHLWKYGENQFWEGIEEANVVTSFLGSYTVFVIPNSSGTYTFKVINISGWESGTRLRRDYNHDGAHDSIIPDKARKHGINLGGNLKQIWTWSEQII